MQHLLACIRHTAAQNQDPDFCPPEVRPRPIKTIYKPKWNMGRRGFDGKELVPSTPKYEKLIHKAFITSKFENDDKMKDLNDHRK